MLLSFMSNHIHLIWQALTGFTPSGVQASFMKYTAQQIKHSLTKYNSGMLAGFKVNKHDRNIRYGKESH